MKCETAYRQNASELYEFIELLKSENVTSYLEIGCKFGGSLWHIGKSLPSGSKIVAVDLPHGDGSFKESEPALRECVEELRKQFKHKVALILDDSTNDEVVEEVRTLGPFDACLIDGSHKESDIRKDWKNYGPLARIVAFHDISFESEGRKDKKTIEVPKVWKELKQGREFKEIKREPRSNGFGILFNG